MIKLNDIKKAIEDKRKELGSSKELRENLNKLKDTASGKAKELAEAMSKGDMEMAKKAIKELADKLKEGKMNKVEMEKLAKDLENMAKELQKLADKHKADKKKLEDQIKKALEKGDLDQAAKLQEKLDQKKAQDKQQEKMQKMAEKMKKCANCMNPGNGKKQPGKDGKQPGEPSEQQAQAAKEAAESLEDMAEQIESMQDAMEDMEALQDLEKAASDIQNAMQGQGDMKNDPMWNDWAKGKGPGGGKRADEEEKTGTFKARDKGKIQKGETVVTGDADGENITGRSVSQTRELISASYSAKSDPLQDLKLPKARREHGQEYFERFRKEK